MRMFHTYRLHMACTAFLLAFPLMAFAHVKWFSAYSFAERPLTLDEILTPLFAILFAAFVAIGFDARNVARMYSPSHYLDTLTPGTHEVRVVLNTNVHQFYVHEGRPLEARFLVVVE